MITVTVAAEQPVGLVIVGGDEGVQVAVLVVIGPGQAVGATDIRSDPFAVLELEVTRSVAEVEEVAAVVVVDQQVEVAVAVDVDPACAVAVAAVGGEPGGGIRRKGAIAVVDVEIVVLPGCIADEKVHVSVVIVVAPGSAYRVLRVGSEASGVHGRELEATQIAEQAVRCIAPVGDEYVDQSVVIVVRQDRGRSPRAGGGDRVIGFQGKGVVAVVPVQVVEAGPEEVGDQQIDVTVVVEVGEARPVEVLGVDGDAAVFDPFERAAVVQVQRAAALGGVDDEEFGVAVVIDVRGHRGGRAGGFPGHRLAAGNLAQGTQIVVVQQVRAGLVLGGHEEIVPAVVVVVEPDGVPAVGRVILQEGRAALVQE